MVYGIAEGSPGPFENITPSGFQACISSKVTFKGNTFKNAPRSARQRKMFNFTPKSRTAILISASGLPNSKASLQATREANSRPSMLGACVSFSFSASMSSVSVEIIQFIAPFLRI